MSKRGRRYNPKKLDSFTCGQCEAVLYVTIGELSRRFVYSSSTIECPFCAMLERPAVFMERAPTDLTVAELRSHHAKGAPSAIARRPARERAAGTAESRGGGA